MKSKINIVIPMAGLGSRFTEEGYSLPKPLIDVLGKPMIQQVVENLGLDAEYIFVVQKEHSTQYDLRAIIKTFCKNFTLIETDGVTRGAACSVLLAKKLVNNDSPVLVANSDQFVLGLNVENLMNCEDGSILCFESSDPKWSYVRHEGDRAIETKEKCVISNMATVGIYFWKRGSDLVDSIEAMIEQNNTLNNEFYLCPSYNYLINQNKNIKIVKVNKHHVFGLGTPQDLRYFIESTYGKQ